MKNVLCRALCLTFFLSLAQTAFSWNHSIQLGYGYSHDPNKVQNHNSAILLMSDIYPFHRSDRVFISLNGSVGHLHSTAPTNKNVTTAALSAGLRLYAFNLGSPHPFYFLGTVGPAYLSKQRLGTNTQGSHGCFQTTLGFGTEFKAFDVNLRLLHYSNANLAKPNQGFNVLYLLSLGYLFG